MKFTIQKNTLVKCLSIVEKALSYKAINDSEKGIKIEVLANKLIFTATKQDLAVQYTLEKDFTVEETGQCLLPGMHLINIVKKTNEDIIEFSNNESNTVLLKTTRSKLNLVEYDLSTYPEIIFNIGEENEFEISKNLLIKSYNQNKAAVSNEVSQIIQNGINFNFENNEVSVHSTDGIRLAISKFNISNNINTNFTIQKNLLSDIIKVIDIAQAEELKLIDNSNQLIIIDENLKIKARLLEGTFPAIEQAIPRDIKYKFIVDNENLKYTLEKIQLLSDREGASVILRVLDNQIQLSSQFRELGKIEEICDIELLEGTPFDISFAPNYLIDAINSISADKLEFQFVAETAAFSITKVGMDDNIQIISPLRMT